MPQIYGQLQNASLEVLASDPSTSTQGRIWFNSTTLQLMVDNGTSKLSFLAGGVGTTLGDMLVYTPSGFQRLPIGANGKVLTADSAQTLGLNWEDLPAEKPHGMDIRNLGLSTAINGSNDLVVTLTTAAGAAQSSTDPVTIPMQQTIGASGTPTQATWADQVVTSALSITVPAAKNLGLVAGGYVWVYAVADTSGTGMQLGVCGGNPIVEAAQTTSGAFGSFSATLSLPGVIYVATFPATPFGVRLIGRITVGAVNGVAWPTPICVEVNPAIRYNSKDNALASGLTISVDTGVAPTFGLSRLVKLWTGRKGQHLTLDYNMSQGSTGTAGTGLYLYQLPGGLSLDTTALNLSSPSPTLNNCNYFGSEIGRGTVQSTNSGLTNFICDAKVYAYDATHIFLVLESGSAQQKIPWSSTSPMTFANSTLSVNFTVEAPIAGWWSFGP